MEESMNLEIANRLVALRKENRLSQEALAEKLGISRQAVSKWERAEASPDTDNLIALARLYHVSLDELLKIQDEEEGDDGYADGRETQLQTVMTDNTVGNDSECQGQTGMQCAGEEYCAGEAAEAGGTTPDYGDGNETETGNGERETDRTAGQSKQAKEDEMHIGLHGIHVKEHNGDEVYVGWDGIHVHDNKNEVHIDRHGIYVNGDKAEGHIFTRGKESTEFPLWFFAIVVYIITGFFFDLWTIGWLIFFLVPVISSLIYAVRQRNGYLFAYPVLVVFVYLYVGLVHVIWHPTWVIFLTIPLYYSFLGYIQGRSRNDEGEDE